VPVVLELLPVEDGGVFPPDVDPVVPGGGEFVGGGVAPLDTPRIWH